VVTVEDRRRRGFRPQPSSREGWPLPHGPTLGGGWASDKLAHMAATYKAFQPRRRRSAYSHRRIAGRIPRWEQPRRQRLDPHRSRRPTLLPPDHPGLVRRCRWRRAAPPRAQAARVARQQRGLPDPSYGLLKLVGAIGVVGAFWWEVARRYSNALPRPLWVVRRLLRDPLTQWRGDRPWGDQLPPLGGVPDGRPPPLREPLLELLGLEKRAPPLEGELVTLAEGAAATAAASPLPNPAPERWRLWVVERTEGWLGRPGAKAPAGYCPPTPDPLPPFPDWGGATPAFPPLPCWLLDWLALLYLAVGLWIIHDGYWWERMPLPLRLFRRLRAIKTGKSRNFGSRRWLGGFPLSHPLPPPSPLPALPSPTPIGVGLPEKPLLRLGALPPPPPADVPD